MLTRSLGRGGHYINLSATLDPTDVEVNAVFMRDRDPDGDFQEQEIWVAVIEP